MACLQASAATNDAFANAQILTGPSGTMGGDNIGATKQSGEPDHADNIGGSSVWYRWTAPSTGQFFFNTAGSDFDTLLAIYTGNNLNNLTVLSSNDDANTNLTSAVSIQAASGTVYRLAIDGYEGATGTVVLAWGPEIPPTNDNFTNAQVISGSSGSVSGTNVGATRESGEPDHAGGPGPRSIWYRWTAPSTNGVLMTTAGSDFNTTLAVYTGTSVNALVEVTSNDEYEADGTSAVIFVPAAGTTYRITVDSYSGQMGAVVLNWGPLSGSNPALAVTFSVVHHFTNDVEGFWPMAPVIGVGNRLYGPTVTHNPGAGTLFAVNPDGTGFAVLKSLNGGIVDGGNPEAEMLASGDTLYGTVSSGGTGFRGGVFAIKTNGTGFNVRHSFTATSGVLLTNADGAGPRAGLVLSGDTLYGVAQLGGNFGAGTVFSMKTNGSAFTTLHHFPELLGLSETNSEGGKPVSRLVIAGDSLFGVAVSGGNSGYGTVFTLKTNGTGFATLRHFNGTDGLFPRALVLAGNVLYGTTIETVFAMNTNGTGFTNLASFVAPGRGTPDKPIVVSGDRIFGSTYRGGLANEGTIYSVRTNGTGFVMLHQFPPTFGLDATNSFGARPHGLSLFGNALYGVTEGGGPRGYGTVFKLSFPPPVISIVPAGTNVVLEWPASPGGFALQRTTNLSSPVGWTLDSSAATIVNSQIIVTNPATDTQTFFRLKSQ